MTGPEQTSCPSGQLPLSPAMPSNSQFMESSLATDVAEGPPLCVRCSLPIFDQFILQLQGQTWHSNCLRCSACQVPLSQMCYSDNAQQYCQDDFFKLFGANCSRCNGIVAPNEIVRRAHEHIYHLGCFRCSVCNSELRTGDEFYVTDDAHLLCTTDFLSTKAKEQEDSLDDEIQLQTIKDVLENHVDAFYLDDAELADEAIDKIAADAGLDSSSVRQILQHKKKDNKCTVNSTNSQKSEMTSRVHPPINGYPLPIVNPGQMTGHHHIDHHQELSSSMKKHIFDQAYLKSLEELWSNDFVPPNVNLEPQHILNGNVIAECLLSNQQQGRQAALCAILSES